MLYYLFDYLDKSLDVPGTGVFQYITFRSGLAVLLSLLLSTIFGKRIIEFLRNQQVGETVRELGLEGQTQKAGTPTMGGLIIILATLVPVFLFAKLDNIYIVLLVVTTLWMGTIGFIDDYIKIFKKDKEGLKGIFKVIGQVGLGLIVGSVLYFHPGVTVRKDTQRTNILQQTTETVVSAVPLEEKSTATTIPFFKNNEFDYADILSFLGDGYETWAWLIFIPIVIFIITAVSNGANLTDGIDGLAAGTSAISVLTLGIFTFVSGNIIFSNYLNIMYIPNSGEMTVFISAFVGSLIGFFGTILIQQQYLWVIRKFNHWWNYCCIAIAIRKEILIPVICGIFLAENLSVVLQVSYFKYTKKKFGEGKRIFLMSPLHHHYQKKGYHESKIVTRFWIVGILLAILSIVTLKLR